MPDDDAPELFHHLTDTAGPAHRKPLMKVSQKDDPLANDLKASFGIRDRVWHTVERPEILHATRVSPWLDVAEPTALQSELRLKASSEFQQRGISLITKLNRHLMTQPCVVVSPDADRMCFLEQARNLNPRFAPPV